MSTAELALDHVSVAFESTVAVADVSFAVAAGSVVGIVGESGSGKTTLARAIAGQVAPTSGRVLLDGSPLPAVKRTRQQRLDIQMVFQDPYSSLNPRMRVGQVLAELLRTHRLVPHSQIVERCRELVRRVRLDEQTLAAYPSQLSGGQRQRVAIARALAVNPRILVADEPTSALDVSVQADVLELFAELRRSLGLTIVLISHDLGVVYQLCERILVMHEGSIVSDTPRDSFFSGEVDEYSRMLISSVPRLPITNERKDNA